MHILNSGILELQHHLAEKFIRFLLLLFYCSVFLNGTSLVCLTTSMANATTPLVSLYFDNVQRQLDATFEFVENPTITSIQPLSSFARCVFLHALLHIYLFGCF